MTEGPENLAIVRTVVNLARSLGLSIVAEGIETREQLETLRELGCDLGQGWLFSKALDPERVEEALADPSTILGPLAG
jgi:EAL domain-containing protein (putative c-di-GMP-specific phosphodiesterase class I)